MLFWIFDEPVPMYISHATFIILLVIGIYFMRKGKHTVANIKWLNNAILSFIHAMYPAIVFMIAGVADIAIYAESLGGINGGSAFSFILFFHLPIMFLIGFVVLLTSAPWGNHKTAQR